MDTIRKRPAVILTVVIAGIVLGSGALAWLIGVFSIERHRGYFAPVWSADGQHVFLVQRDSFGLVFGLGWESFTPPASTIVFRDSISLRRIDVASGAVEVLERFDGSPVQGRITKHYHGRIFNFMSAQIEPLDGGAAFRIRMDIPRVPRSEMWSLTGRWEPGRPSDAKWVPKFAGSTATPDAVLRDGVELMAVPGRESYPAAIIAVGADGAYRVLVKNDAFDDLYPHGIPGPKIAERSNRQRIERSRELRRVHQELVTRYRQQGLNEGEALLRTSDAMEELGYYPKTPRLVAEAVTEAPPDVRVFDIPANYFNVGLFRDIAEAIADPGTEVKTDTGTYLKYYDDETGPRLRAWRKAGNDRFAVRTEGRLYVMQVHRFDR